MKYLSLIILILGFVIYGCNSQNFRTDKSEKQAEISQNRDEIQKLIREVLIWSASKETIDLLPVIEDSKNNVYSGFDMDKLKDNLNKLKQTGFFAIEFIENYNQIIRTIDKKLRNKEVEAWLVGDLPTFNFVNDINPWCQCQGFSQEDFGSVEIIKIDSKSGELKWKWKAGSSWNDFKFRVMKEDGKWKISYMEGFDFKHSTK
jgi:hypothetical protein